MTLKWTIPQIWLPSLALTLIVRVTLTQVSTYIFNLFNRDTYFEPSIKVAFWGRKTKGEKVPILNVQTPFHKSLCCSCIKKLKNPTQNAKEKLCAPWKSSVVAATRDESITTSKCSLTKWYKLVFSAWAAAPFTQLYKTASFLIEQYISTFLSDRFFSAIFLFKWRLKQILNALWNYYFSHSVDIIMRK